MSIYNKPDIKINIGCNTPSVCHKKINSVNFSSSNTNRYTQGNSKKYISKNQLNLKSSSNLNSESNLLNYNSHLVQSSNINKVLTSANLKNRRIEIDLNKNNSPRAKFNKSMGENMILFKNRQNTSQNNINNINNLNNNINYNINNNTQVNNNKNKNSSNNINININISKKIISTYYNKSKGKNNIIVKKKSINSLDNSNTKENKPDNINNNKDILIKNQSQTNFSKLQNNNNNDSYFLNYYSNNPSNNNNKIAPNHSLGYFSTTSTNTNKNTSNTNNIYINCNTSSNYVNTEKYTSNSNYYSARDLIKKNYTNSVNKIIKESKPTNISSQISGKINMLQHSSNINSIQNYLKYLNIGQKNKNYNKKNSPLMNKNKTHKLSENNINYYHNNTESNIYNTTYNFENKNNLAQKTYSRLKDSNNNIKIMKNNSNYNSKINSGGNEINGVKIETPDELHFFYVKLIQEGKGINFDRQFKK